MASSGENWLTDRMRSLHKNLLVERMRSLGYEADEGGVCFGISHMAVQAILAKDFATFEKRLALINSIPVDKFKETLEGLDREKVGGLKKRNIDIIKQVKNEIGPYRALTQAELAQVKNDEETKSKLDELKKSFDAKVKLAQLLRSDRTKYAKEYEEQKARLLFNAFMQKKVEERQEKDLTLDEKIKLSIPSFFDSIQIYQSPKQYAPFFPDNIKTNVQDAARSASLVSPRVLEPGNENKSDMVTIGKFSGMYTKNELVKYFDGLSNAYSKFNEPVPFILSSENHSIMVGYDPSKKSWYLLDPNHLTTVYTSSSQEMANLVDKAFFGKTVFSTTIYGNKSNELILSACMEKWKSSPTWKDLHEVKSEKSGDYKAWLDLAAQDGDLDSVERLLASGHKFASEDESWTPLDIAAYSGHADIVKKLLEDKNIQQDRDHADIDGETSLYTAAQNGHLDVVVELLRNNCNPAIANKNGVTPLFVAAQNGHVEIVKELLKKEDSSNVTNKDGQTLLHVAVANEDIEMVKELLKLGVNPNANGGGVTSLFMAAENGNLEICKALLGNNAESSLATESDMTTLRQYAKECKAENNLDALLKQKNIPDTATNIHLTPLDIARMMGHTAVANLIQSHENKRAIVATEETKSTPGLRH